MLTTKSWFIIKDFSVWWRARSITSIQPKRTELGILIVNQTYNLIPLIYILVDKFKHPLYNPFVIFTFFYNKCEAPTSKKLITVEGISVTDSMAELFLEDGSCLTIDSDILHKAIMSQEPKENLEMCT